jgi:MFS family permease
MARRVVPQQRWDTFVQLIQSKVNSATLHLPVRLTVASRCNVRRFCDPPFDLVEAEGKMGDYRALPNSPTICVESPSANNLLQTSSSPTNMSLSVTLHDSLLTPSPPPPTPLPMARVALVGLMLLVNHFSLFVIFPFLPFMIQDFFPGVAYQKLGLYAGLLAGSFNVGALLAGVLWGKLADRIGRRPVLLLGIVGTTSCVLLFGFSRSYWMAVLARFLWGALNGNIPIAKTYLSEICDDSNQAKGFAVIGFAASVGRLIGPIVGGILAQPASKYPHSIFGSMPLFITHPYLLPMLVGAIICTMVFPFAFIVLKESMPENNLQQETQEIVPLAEVLKASSVWKSITLFGMLSFAAYMIEELFSLWLALPVLLGGFGLESSRIGLVLTLCAPIPLFSQAIVFPKLVDKIGFKQVFLRSLAGMGLIIAVVPFSTFLLSTSVPLAWTVLIASFTCFMIGRFFGFASVYALINNSCHIHRGAVNGAGQSIASFARIIAPIVGGYMFTWTIEHKGVGQVIDVRAVFYFLGIWCMITAYLAATLPSNIDRKVKVVMSFNSESVSSAKSG